MKRYPRISRITRIKTSRSALRRWLYTGIALLSSVLILITALAYRLAGSPLGPELIGPSAATANLSSPPAERQKTTSGLRVMTFNIAHGGQGAIHHWFQATARIRANLNEIAALLQREQPHLVALQEADGSRLRDRHFNPLRYLAAASGFQNGIRGRHAHGLGLSYGTALLSRLPLSAPQSFHFAPSPPSFPKGWVLASVPWPGANGQRVDVVSLHLDFLRAAVRSRQLERVAQVLEQRRRPLIVMGDFNAGRPQISRFSQRLQLHAYQPAAQDLATFPLSGRRLDWILISRGLRFRRYAVVPARLSDHLAVVAEITR